MSIRFFVKIQKGVHNSVMSDRHQAPSYPLRLAPILKSRVAREAAIAGRSFNAEVATRLERSLSADLFAWSSVVQQAVDNLVAQDGCTPDEALTRLVLAGQGKGGTVLHISIAPGTTAKDVLAGLEGTLKLVPPDATVLLTKN
jgi:hypothetical protein